MIKLGIYLFVVDASAVMREKKFYPDNAYSIQSKHQQKVFQFLETVKKELKIVAQWFTNLKALSDL